MWLASACGKATAGGSKDQHQGCWGCCSEGRRELVGRAFLEVPRGLCSGRCASSLLPLQPHAADPKWPAESGRLGFHGSSLAHSHSRSQLGTASIGANRKRPSSAETEPQIRTMIKTIRLEAKRGEKNQKLLRPHTFELSKPKAESECFNSLSNVERAIWRVNSAR